MTKPSRSVLLSQELNHESDNIGAIWDCTIRWLSQELNHESDNISGVTVINNVELSQELNHESDNIIRSLVTAISIDSTVSFSPSVNAPRPRIARTSYTTATQYSYS